VSPSRGGGDSQAWQAALSCKPEEVPLAIRVGLAVCRKQERAGGNGYWRHHLHQKKGNTKASAKLHVAEVKTSTRARARAEPVALGCVCGGAGCVCQPLCLLMAMGHTVAEKYVLDLYVATVPAQGVAEQPGGVPHWLILGAHPLGLAPRDIKREESNAFYVHEGTDAPPALTEQRGSADLVHYNGSSPAAQREIGMGQKPVDNLEEFLTGCQWALILDNEAKEARAKLGEHQTMVFTDASVVHVDAAAPRAAWASIIRPATRGGKL